MKLFNALKLERFFNRYRKWIYIGLFALGVFLLFGCGTSKKTIKTDVQEETEIVAEKIATSEKVETTSEKVETKDTSIIITDSEEEITTIKADTIIIEPHGTIKAQGNVSVQSSKKVAQTKENKDVSVSQSNKKEENQLTGLSEKTTEQTTKSETTKTTESKNETNIVQDLKGLVKWVAWLLLIIVAYIVYRDTEKRV